MKKHKITMFVALVAFALLVGSLVNASGIFKGQDSNTADIEKEQHMSATVEGSFYDKDGDLIYGPEKPYQVDETYLPVEYSYLLGYNNSVYESTGLRNLYYEHLYEDKGSGKGGSIKLTVDDVLQAKAYAALRNGDLSGSVVVMDAKNAEILAMVGRREMDYNINKLEENWAKYKDIDAFFMAPATGDYKAPGSVFKVLTSAAAIKNGMQDYVYEDTGELEIDNIKIRNASDAVYGEQDLQGALITSTNTYFASLSLRLGEKTMKSIFNDFLVGQQIDLGFATLTSAANLTGADSNLAMVGFGQGGVAVSPLHIAMIGQSIVNKGRMIQPTLVKALYDAKGKELERNIPHSLLTQTVTAEVAEEVKALMKGVVDEKYPDWKTYSENIYAKTGTAQASDNATKYNSYFLCMTEEYVIVVSVNDTASHGGDYAYIAESLLNELY